MRAPPTRSYHQGTGIPRPIAVGIHAHQQGVRTLHARLGLVLLALAYVLAAGLGARTVTESGYGGADSSTTGYSLFGPSGLLLHHAPAKEGLAQPYSAPPATSAKDRTPGFAVMVRAQHHTVRVAFVRSTIAARSMLTALRRCALLFPFHHFW